jgi:SAM-dependent methyltransferase
MPSVIRWPINKAKAAIRLACSILPLQVSIKRPRKTPLDMPRYEYQERFNKFDIPDEAVVIDVGSGNYPFPRATILCDCYLDPTVHRHSAIVRDERPLVICDVCNLPFPDKYVDFIYCSHVLEHVDDPMKACSELQRVAKAGYIETPNFMKDVLFSWAQGMHKWHTVAINNELHFFEYTERQAKGIQSMVWEEIILGRTYHKLQDVFWDNQDLFNTMFSWQNNFTCVVHREY